MKAPALLFFGGNKISVTIATPSVNGTHSVKGYAEKDYGGIVWGEFVNGDNLAETVQECINSATEDAKSNGINGISKLIIATPPQFCQIQVISIETNLKVAKRIKKNDIDNLNAIKIDTAPCEPPSTMVDRRAIYYKIDNGGAIMDPVGALANSIQVQTSVTMVTDKFIKKMGEALGGKEWLSREIRFVPTSLAEGMELVDQDIRDKTCVLISCGLLSTGISVITGDCLVAIESFDMGMAHVINDVSVIMKVPYKEASDMLLKPVKKVTDIVNARLEEIGKYLLDLITRMDKKLLTRPFFICGGYTDAILGAKESFERSLGVKITQVCSPQSGENRADVVTRDACVNFAVR